MGTKTEVDISNETLGILNVEDYISGLGDDSTNAKRCKRAYPICRRALFEEYDYPFAIKTKTLSLSTEEVDGYEYVYTYPTDVLRIIKLFSNEFSNIDYDEVSSADGLTTLIVCNTPQASIKYMYDCVTTTRYTENFSMYLSYKMADFLAGRYQLKSDEKKIIKFEMDLFKSKSQEVSKTKATLENKLVSSRGY